jgi:hypothetical protein
MDRHSLVSVYKVQSHHWRDCASLGLRKLSRKRPALPLSGEEEKGRVTEKGSFGREA